MAILRCNDEMKSDVALNKPLLEIQFLYHIKHITKIQDGGSNMADDIFENLANTANSELFGFYAKKYFASFAQ